VPFVRVGDHVQEGQNIVIIEAMKVMNQIKSPKSGKIISILIQDGQPVEFGTPLFELS
jgi:biotin carboxyl carrier protein